MNSSKTTESPVTIKQAADATFKVGMSATIVGIMTALIGLGLMVIFGLSNAPLPGLIIGLVGFCLMGASQLIDLWT